MLFCIIFFFKQKTAYEMRISDWSSDVCSSDLDGSLSEIFGGVTTSNGAAFSPDGRIFYHADTPTHAVRVYDVDAAAGTLGDGRIFHQFAHRSEEHTSELQSLMRISYAVFCLKQKKEPKQNNTP